MPEGTKKRKRKKQKSGRKIKQTKILNVKFVLVTELPEILRSFQNSMCAHVLEGQQLRVKPRTTSQNDNRKEK